MDWPSEAKLTSHETSSGDSPAESDDDVVFFDGSAADSAATSLSTCTEEDSEPGSPAQSAARPVAPMQAGNRGSGSDLGHDEGSTGINDLLSPLEQQRLELQRRNRIRRLSPDHEADEVDSEAPTATPKDVEVAFNAAVRAASPPPQPNPRDDTEAANAICELIIVEGEHIVEAKGGDDPEARMDLLEFLAEKLNTVKDHLPLAGLEEIRISGPQHHACVQVDRDTRGLVVSRDKRISHTRLGDQLFAQRRDAGHEPDHAQPVTSTRYAMRSSTRVLLSGPSNSHAGA